MLRSEFLTPRASYLLRQLLANGLVLYNSIVDDVLEQLSLPTPHSTAARSFSLEYHELIPRDDANHYLKWLGGQSGIAPDALLAWVLEERVVDNRIYRIAANAIFKHTAAGMSDLASRMDSILETATSCTALLEKPTGSLLTQGVRQILCRQQTEGMSGAFGAFRVESDFARDRFVGFDHRREDWKFAPVCILSRAGMDSLMGATRFEQQRDFFVENLLDREEIGSVKLAYLDDRPGRRAAGLHGSFKEFDARGVIEAAYSLRRHRSSLHRYLFQSNDSAAQAAMVDEDRKIVEQATRVAVFDFAKIEQWLLEYASDRCWRKLKRRHDENW